MSCPGSSQTGTTRRGLLKSAAGIAAAAALPHALARAAFAFDNQSSLLTELSRKLAGRLLRPTDADYLAWAVSANTRFDSVLPLAAVLCANEADVRHAIVAANPGRHPARRARRRAQLPRHVVDAPDCSSSRGACGAST